jgi:choline dehydrogenase-like flavoprotein
MRKRHDVVVIGSGFGGAINACRLAQAGRSVCVLERGKHWGRKDFPRATGQVARAFWNERDHGLLDYRTFSKTDVIQASGVGVGSLVYFNYTCARRLKSLSIRAGLIQKLSTPLRPSFATLRKLFSETEIWLS